MRKHPPLPEDDDGRQIADMSGVDGGPGLPWPRKVPGAPPPRPAAPPEPGAPQRPRRPWEPDPNELTPEERRIYLFAAVKAALAIGMFYIVGLGAVVLFLLWLWR